MTDVITAAVWVRPSLETQVHMDRWQGELPDQIRAAEKALADEPENIELIKNLGRELSRAGLFREAVDVYSQGIMLDPLNHLLYRHRGHRYISTRRYLEAAVDLSRAAELCPSHWDTLYHLGLAHYLLGNFAAAEAAYARCLSVTEEEEHLPAIVDWYYLTLMRLGKKAEAQAVAERVSPHTQAGENEPYKQRILVYRGLSQPDDVLAQLPAGDDHMYCTGAFGIAMELYFRGEHARARELIADINKRVAAWFGFAALAAEVEARRL